MKMKEFRSTLANQLEFTIHGLDECDISNCKSPSPYRDDEEISTEVLSQQDDEEVNQAPSEDEQLTQLKVGLKDRETFQESSLLQDLKTMKEEAWAKRKARKLRREQKKVQFQDPVSSPVPFCRSCCVGKNEMRLSSYIRIGSGAKEEIETNSNSGESGDSLFISHIGKKERPLNRIRPTAHIHSINMFENIIPRHILDNRMHAQGFVPFSTPLAKMLADIVY